METLVTLVFSKLLRHVLSQKEYDGYHQCCDGVDKSLGGFKEILRCCAGRTEEVADRLSVCQRFRVGAQV